MFPWFPLVLPQTCRRTNNSLREPARDGIFIEVHTVSAPTSIETASVTSQTPCLRINYKINTLSTKNIRLKSSQTTSLFNSNSTGICVDKRIECSSTIIKKPVDNLNAQFFWEQNNKKSDLKNVIIERQLSPNDENKQEASNDENKQSSKKVGGYTRPKTTIKIIHPPGGKSSMFW
ncbi:hypothetical protein Mgra_00002963 [Meloidogyne graminicola]|uniref:Uncharacterized protein n=1 Tax=Meloidogyne graminicola TaxID=189291 RepID=A0A8S9ZVG5_9BILA|nr:hypothetical protein Mgra_00002963 [Meloidogyne graminicola]